jgi:hypothetical protein
MTLLRFAVFALLLITSVHATSCRQKQVTSGSVRETLSPKVEGGKGTSFEDAVVILDTTETSGIAAEYTWLRLNYPGYTMISQSLVTHEGKPYDVLNIKTDEGDKIKVYFDISHFFGKF